MQDVILNGKQSSARLTGLHPVGSDQMKLYFADREPEMQAFHPFMHVTENVASPLDEAFHLEALTPLDGDLPYSHLARFTGLDQFYEAKKWLRRNHDSDAYYVEHSPTVQFMQDTGITTYEDLSMSDLTRMQVDIETLAHGGFPNSERREDEVVIIAVSTNQGTERLLHTATEVSHEKGIACKGEKEMLDRFLRLLHRIDPDVLEFHNGFGFDLRYLRDRFELHNLPFAIGRDNSTPKSWESTKAFAERDIDYENFVVAGRSVVDSYFMAHDYDTYARELPSYGLKELAKHFGFAKENREYVEGDKITQIWKSDPQRLLDYALDDVTETKLLVEELGNATFALTKMVPMTWQETVIGGSAMTLEAILVREYMRQGHSLPDGSDPMSFKGGFTEIFRRGVFEDCFYADVSSLYPSIMLRWDVEPDRDSLSVFLPMLDSLTSQRLENKNKLAELSEDSQEYSKVDAQQAAQKVLINSAYGLLGTPYAIFSDMEKAAFVTKKGRGVLKKMIRDMQSMGATPISSDTDGVMVQKPKGRSINEMIQKAESRQPDGIKIDNDGEFSPVFSYKSKNYAKVPKGEPLDDVEIKGASLMGRQKAPFLREYIQGQIQRVLKRDIRGMHDLHEEYKDALLTRSFSAEELCKTQRLKKSLDEYEDGVESNPNKYRLAQYEVAKRKWEITGQKPLKGDVVKYYVSLDPIASEWKASRDARLLREYNGDENLDYYMERLNKTAELFYPFLEHPETVLDPDTSQGEQGGLFGQRIDFDSMQIKETKLNNIPQ